MNQILEQAIESVLCDEFDAEIEYTRLRRISNEISKFGGVRDL
jgi:hypothetical protein